MLAGPFNIELFGGSPDDTNAFYFYDGAMSVMQPYHRQWHARYPEWSDGHGQSRYLALGLATVAQARMDNLLSAYYTDKRVDAVLSPYDGLSIGILSSLRALVMAQLISPGRSLLARMLKLPPSRQ